MGKRFFTAGPAHLLRGSEADTDGRAFRLPEQCAAKVGQEMNARNARRLAERADARRDAAGSAKWTTFHGETLKNERARWKDRTRSGITEVCFLTRAGSLLASIQPFSFPARRTFHSLPLTPSDAPCRKPHAGARCLHGCKPESYSDSRDRAVPGRGADPRPHSTGGSHSCAEVCGE